ncbi:MAG: hypothetical protein UX48_C0036G0008 [Candidatus Azambacteria bacterium GW2011_GWB1_46_27]|uniref:Uncharacterized protein n=1 Tax=Candidatus Azambacteria bacterium GW2011_GWB1_46_27 TaxID=1618617 RepID=A0A0G1PP34_9BACT|nr:MAG: hypothetical protein UX48_C0036G0008 [Candidatus Azambacteria bacterium GW2011_GWB1_46_27]
MSDSVDHPGFVVRDIDNSAGLNENVNRPSERALVREPAGNKVLLSEIIALLIQFVTDDFVAGRHGSVRE